jgi:hypothetical protein
MADKKISELASGSAVSTSVVPVSDSAGTATTKVTLGAIAALGGGPPAAHASTHGTGGSDQVTPAAIGAAAASHTHAAADITSGVLAAARLPSATTTAAGAVVVGSGINVSSGTISATAASVGAAATAHTHTLAAITDAGTAASKSVPAAGNASATQVVLGSDTRLSDSRTPTSHAHGNLTNNGSIGSVGDQIVVTTTGGALTTQSSLYEYQVYVSDMGTGNFGTDDALGSVISSIDSALTYTNGNVNTLTTSVSSANTNISSLQTADTYIPGYDGIADANDWVSRVSAQSASVSTATRAAVTRFCVAIAAAGLRSKVWRLNVFVGNSIAAAMVPIYRGPSRSGTQYGGSLDTNNNFASGSWTEAGGLVGNGSTRYLTLGTFAQLRTDWSTGHIGIDYTGMDSTERNLLGGFFNESITSPRGWYRIWASTTYGVNCVFGLPTRSGFTQASNFKIMNRASSTSHWLYESGERVSYEDTASNTATTQPGGQFCIMAASYTNVSGGSPTTSVNGNGPAAGTCRGYTIGDSMTQFQQYAFGSAWLRLQQELGRS